MAHDHTSASGPDSGSDSSADPLLGDDWAMTRVAPTAAAALHRALDLSHGRSAVRDPGASFAAGVAPTIALGEQDQTTTGRRSKDGRGRDVSATRIPLSWRRTPTRSLILRSVIAGAAVLILGIVAPQVFSSRTSTSPATTYATSVGERMTVTLADGVRATLAPLTTLTMRDNDATLSGEAAFVVTHHSRTPLTIHTGRVVTKVLGTTFGIRHYPTDTRTRVFVLDGKVSTGATRTATLVARTVAQVTDSTVTTEAVSDISVLNGWVDGRLSFRDTPVTEVLTTVGRWYGVTFRLPDSTIKRYRLTATFDVHWSRSEVLAALESALGVRMNAVGDTVILTRQEPSNRHSHDALASPRHTAGDSFTPSMDVGR